MPSSEENGDGGIFSDGFPVVSSELGSVLHLAHSGCWRGVNRGSSREASWQQWGLSLMCHKQFCEAFRVLMLETEGQVTDLHHRAPPPFPREVF